MNDRAGSRKFLKIPVSLVFLVITAVMLYPF